MIVEHGLNNIDQEVREYEPHMFPRAVAATMEAMENERNYVRRRTRSFHGADQLIVRVAPYSIY